MGDASSDREASADSDQRRAWTVAGAVEALQSGDPVLVHDADDREGETDLVYPAASVTPDDVARLRNDAGGLVCVALTDAAATALELPFLADAVDHPSATDGDLAYGDRASFSLTVNHRETFTGVTDADRALTIAELAPTARAAERGECDAEAFAATFRTPGHVHLLRGAPDLLADRRGHTELALALVGEAGLDPAAVVCEMLDDATGGALSPARARGYARRHGLVYLEGRQVVDALA